MTMTPLAIALLGLLMGPAPANAADAVLGSGDADPAASQAAPQALATPAATPPLRRWLTRKLPASARFLDHGVVQLAVAGGAPHIYRAELGLGLFDHLSLGVTARWLPDEARPRWSPKVALAVYRARWWAFGFRYAQVLHREQVVDSDPETPDFVERSHYIFGTLAFAQNNFSGGLDAGVVHTRDLPLDPAAPAGTFRERMLPAGGLFLRYGTRRWGVTLQGEMPVYTLELAVDLRFGLFEMRERGGWRPSGLSSGTSR